ncbi:MAG: right-handed parallel beta-helix repeat-containing protein [Candidatus Atribacteria bacterium]|nr:right-handed parallel beta-helix repeat-containing protein [Candidatus Atribacteria bacterium]
MNYRMGSFIPFWFVVFFVLVNGCYSIPPTESTSLPVTNSTQGISFSTIQEAIDAALPGDVIIVAPGTYHENIDFKGKNITVRSSNPPSSQAVTIIDGNHAGPVVSFRNGEGNTAVLEGFTIQNGKGTHTSGGGITCINSSPTILSNVIISNSAEKGGGISCSAASPQIRDNKILLNSATSGGGGIYCGESSSPVIKRNTITTNSATHASNGGGIFCSDSTPIIVSNDLSWNEASNGGGIYCLSSTVAIAGNTFTKNQATQKGGGIFVSKSSAVTDAKGNPWPRLNTPPNAETRNSYSGNTHQGGFYSPGADVYFEPELTITIPMR